MKNLPKEPAVQFIKFSTIGFLTFCIDFISLFLLRDVIKIPLILATSIAFILGVCFHFTSNKFFTFQSNGSVKKQLPPYLIFTGLSYLSTVTLMYLLVEKLLIHYLIAKVLIVGFNLLWSFPAQKFITFRR